MQYSRDDDFLDFLLAHHAKEERQARCFAIGNRHICARCTGWFAASVAFGILIIILGVKPPGYFYLLSVPAFVDWGGRRLGFFGSGKAMAFFTGVLMGLAIPGFVMGVLSLDMLAIAGLFAYLALFSTISMLTHAST